MNTPSGNRRNAVLCGTALCLLSVFFIINKHAATQPEPVFKGFGKAELVTVNGYTEDIMEPFISRDGKTLYFNNSNATGVNTEILSADRQPDGAFMYRGPVPGVNSPVLDGVATMDDAGWFYFVSVRSYDKDQCTIYRGRMKNGTVTGVAAVPGVSEKIPGHVNFDVDITPDGKTLYFVDSIFHNGQPAHATLTIAEKQPDGSFKRRTDSSKIMASVNTGKLQYAACISRDQKTLYFTRLSAGLPPRIGIFVAHRSSVNAPFETPMKVEACDGFVEAAALTPDEKTIYFHRKDGSKYRLYRTTLK